MIIILMVLSLLFYSFIDIPEYLFVNEKSNSMSKCCGFLNYPCKRLKSLFNRTVDDYFKKVEIDSKYNLTNNVD